MDRPSDRTVWIAEDNPGVAKALAHYLEAHGARVVLTDDSAVARHWLQNPEGPIVLDGSVWEETGIPMWDLPAQAILYTGDEDIVCSARRLGRTAFLKGIFGDDKAFLAALGIPAQAPAPVPAER